MGKWTVLSGIGNTSGGEGAPIDPNDFTIGTLTSRWVNSDAAGSVSVEAEVLIPVTPPGLIGTIQGGHIYVELEDQSSGPPFRLGTSGLGGGDATVGNWDLWDMGKFPYVATEQPWVLRLPDISPRRTTVVRVYVEPYSDQVDAAPIRAGQPDETPNATVTIPPYQAGKPSSGVSVTTALVTSVVATAADPILVSGKLRRPISVTVTLPTNPPDNWAYQLIGYVNGDLESSPVLASGALSRDVATDPVPAGDDGIVAPHTFGNEEPSEIQNVVIYAVAGLIMPKPVPRGQTPGPAEFVANKIVPGITVSASVTIGTPTGVIDAANLMLDSYSAEFHIDPATGKWAMQNVDFSKATNFNTSDFQIDDDGAFTYNLVDLFKATNFNAAEFDRSGGVFLIKALAADKLKTGILEVGGANFGGERVSRLKIFDVATPTPNLIGWIGDDSAASGFVGAWFKRVLIGGSSPATAQIVADASGNVAISGALLVSGTVYLGALGSGTLPVGVTYAGTILASQIGSGTLPVGVIYAGTVLASQIGSGTLPVGVIYAGNITTSQLQSGTITASITMTAPTLVITSGTVTVNIDATNMIKVADSAVSPPRYTSMESDQFRVDSGASLTYTSLKLGDLTHLASGGAFSMSLTAFELAFNGLRVVTSRQSALTGALGATIGTAGATYTATEQALLNSVINLANNIRTRVGDMESRLKAHGLIS